MVMRCSSASSAACSPDTPTATRDEATFVGAFVRAVGFLTLIVSLVGSIILLANSRPLAGFQVFVTGVASASVTYGVGLLLKMGVERG